MPTSPLDPAEPPHRKPSPNASLSAVVRRPRLALAAGLFVATTLGLAAVADWRWPTIVLVAWNFAAIVHLALMLHMMATSDGAATVRRARRLDESAAAILGVAVAASSACLLAVFAELAVSKEAAGILRSLHVGLGALTVFTAWSFIQTMFAIHYAHLHAIARADGATPGLRIPGEDHPDYWDFLYVAVSIGTSGQTADVEFTGKTARRVALVHSAIAFFFNATVLALTINIAAGLV